jgi:PLP dependent protein
MSAVQSRHRPKLFQAKKPEHLFPVFFIPCLQRLCSYPTFYGIILKEINMSIQDNIIRIRHEIELISRVSERSPSEVTLMAVTKKQCTEAVSEALAAGISCFGENRIQEAAEKYTGHPARTMLHIIGHVQSNKAAKAVELADWIDSVDSLKLLKKIDGAAGKLGKTVQVLFEYNISGESSKSGFENESDLFEALEFAGKCKNVSPRGLMTIGPLSDNPDIIRSSFIRMRSIFEKAVQQYPQYQFDQLSMGMSNDWKIAVEEGSTLIRVGTAIFGARTQE